LRRNNINGAQHAHHYDACTTSSLYHYKFGNKIILNNTGLFTRFDAPKTYLCSKTVQIY